MADSIGARAALVRHYAAPLVIEDVEIEAPRADEVRVRMVGVGICHTDIVFRDGEDIALPTPCVLGHEGSGIVEDVGADVVSLIPGDHVVLSFHSCGACRNCADAMPCYCDHMGPLNYGGCRADGSSPVSQHGARVSAAFFNQSSFATHAIAHVRNAVKVPKDVPLDILGPLGCGILTGAGAAINALKVGPGASLAIFGGGSVGLSALLGALTVGAGPVIVVEPNAGRRDTAMALGAAHAIDPIAHPDVASAIHAFTNGGASHALDTTGLDSVILTAAASLAMRGMLGILGMPKAMATLPVTIMELMSKGLTVKGIVEGDADPQAFIPHLIDLFQKGRFPFDRLITRYPFEQINEAIASSIKGSVIKPVLIFSP